MIVIDDYRVELMLSYGWNRDFRFQISRVQISRFTMGRKYVMSCESESVSVSYRGSR